MVTLLIEIRDGRKLCRILSRKTKLTMTRAKPDGIIDNFKVDSVFGQLAQN